MLLQSRCTAAFGAALVVGVLFSHRVSAIVVRFDGAPGDPAFIDPAFVAATATHEKQFIDFENDGFDDLAPHTFRPIAPDHYASLNLTLLNLDARSVGTQHWSHSPPIGAWHTGFSTPPTTPYSFRFGAPVASFGLFLNDVEGTVTVTVHSTTNGAVQFTIPFQGGADIGQFHGFVAPSNQITQIDFMSLDYHILDDVQFGYVPEPASAIALTIGTLPWMARRRRNWQS